MPSIGHNGGLGLCIILHNTMIIIIIYLFWLQKFCYALKTYELMYLEL